MPAEGKELKKRVQRLVVQEIRLLQLEQSFTPQIIIDEISRSIQEIKSEMIRLTRGLSDKKRTTLLKEMIYQAIDEEIDHLVDLRKTRCIRCIHGRFYDDGGKAYIHLPLGDHRAQSIGCDEFRTDLRESCHRFVEIPFGSSWNHFLKEMTLLYEFRDWIDQIEEIWKDYLIK